MPLHLITPNVPRTIATKTIKSIYLSGVSSILGWIFISAGFIVIFSLLAASDAKYAFIDTNKWGETNATVTAVKPLYGKDSKMLIGYRYNYEFSIANKKYYNSSESDTPHTAITTTANIRYWLTRPDTSNIIGMDSGKMPWYTSLYFIIFVFIGIGALVYNHNRKHKMIYLLEHGTAVYAQYYHKEMTDTETNDIRHAEYTFKFEVADKTYFAKTRTPRYNTIEDEEKELILYLPDNPTHNFVYEGNDWVPTINNEGEFNPETNSIVNFLPYLSILGLFIGLSIFVLSIYFA